MRLSLVLAKIVGTLVLWVLFGYLSLNFALPGSGESDITAIAGWHSLFAGLVFVFINFTEKQVMKVGRDRTNMFLWRIEYLLTGLAVGMLLAGDVNSANTLAPAVMLSLIGLLVQQYRMVKPDRSPHTTSYLIARQFLIRVLLGGGLTLAAFSFAKVGTRRFDLFVGYSFFENPVVLVSYAIGFWLLERAVWRAPPFVYAHLRPHPDLADEREWSDQPCNHCGLPPTRVIAATGQCITCGYTNKVTT